MSEIDQVWVVTTGCYSDYSVDSVWASEEEARTYAAHLADGNDPEPMDVRRGLPELVTWYEVTRFYPDGCPFFDERFAGPAEVKERQAWDWNVPAEVKVPVAHRSHVTVYEPGCSYGKNHVFLRVFGLDRERVAKVFSERWAQIVADFDILIAARRAEIEERRAEIEAQAHAALEQAVVDNPNVLNQLSTAQRRAWDEAHRVGS